MPIRRALSCSTVFLLTAFLCYAVPASAQTPEDDVLAVIEDLFDGMRAGDSTAVRAVFAEKVGFVTTSVGKDGTPMMREVPLDGFLQAVGTPHNEVWDERVWDPQVHVQDNLASVWIHYAFYVGETYSHCGVDTFQLFRSEAGWKIIFLADTRRQECDIPAWE